MLLRPCRHLKEVEISAKRTETAAEMEELAQKKKELTGFGYVAAGEQKRAEIADAYPGGVDSAAEKKNCIS